MKKLVLLIALLGGLSAQAALKTGIYKLNVNFGESNFTDVLILDKVTSQRFEGFQRMFLTYEGTLTVPGNFTVKIEVEEELNFNTLKDSFTFKLRTEEFGRELKLDFKGQTGLTFADPSIVPHIHSGAIKDAETGDNVGRFTGALLHE